jgi:hypothetical protein
MSETSVPIYQTRRCHKSPQHINIHLPDNCQFSAQYFIIEVSIFKFTHLGTAVTKQFTCFNFQKFCVLSLQCAYVLVIILTVSCDDFSVQN